MSGKATRQTVAKVAGVSLSTVSYVLNDSRYVSPKLKKRVDDAIEQLNYCPDMAARSMVTKQTKILSIVANDMTNSMYGEIIMAFEKEAVQRGYFVNICSGQFSLREYIKMMIARRIDGLFFASVPDKVVVQDIDMLVQNNVSIACGNYLLPKEERINRVDIDYRGGIEIVVEHLAELGHKNITYMNGFNQNYPMDVKCDAFKDIMNEMGNANPSIVYGFGPNNLTDAEGRVLAAQIMKEFPKTTAIVCYSDLMAYGTMQALHSMGYKIPDDISVVGIENLKTSNFTYPPLTSLSFDRTDFSKLVIDILIEHFKTSATHEALVPMKLCIRESTALCTRSE